MFSIKKFAFFGVFLLAVSMVSGAVFAQNTNQSEQPLAQLLVSDVVIDAKTYSPGDVVSGSFNILNVDSTRVANDTSFDFVIVSDYQMGLTQKTHYSEESGVSFSLNPEEKRRIDFQFTIPNIPNGDYGLRIQSKRKTGAASSYFDAFFTVQNSSVQPLKLEINDLVVAKGEDVFTAQAGPTFYENELVEVLVALENTSSNSVTFRTEVEYTNMSGAVVSRETLDSFTIAPNEDKIIELELQNFETPGVYLAQMRFVAEDGTVLSQEFFARYIIGGDIVTIHDFSIDKTKLNRNTPFNVSLSVTGSPFDFFALEFLDEDPTETSVRLELMVVDARGQIIDSFTDEYLLTDEMIVINIPLVSQIKANGVQIKAYFYDQEGNLITEYISGLIDYPSSNLWLQILVLALSVIVLTFVYIKLKARTKIMQTLSVLLLVGGSMILLQNIFAYNPVGTKMVLYDDEYVKIEWVKTMEDNWCRDNLGNRLACSGWSTNPSGINLHSVIPSEELNAVNSSGVENIIGSTLHLTGAMVMEACYNSNSASLIYQRVTNVPANPNHNGNTNPTKYVIQSGTDTEIQRVTNVTGKRSDWYRGVWRTAGGSHWIWARTSFSIPLNVPDTVGTKTETYRFVGCSSNKYTKCGYFEAEVTYTVKKLPDEPPPPPSEEISCYASPSGDVHIYEQMTWIADHPGDQSYTYSWSGNDGLSGEDSTATMTYTTPGTKEATLTLTPSGGGAPINVSCEKEIKAMSLSCLADPTSVAVNQQVTFTATPRGGKPDHSYSWVGALSETSNSIQRAFSSTGTQTFNVTVTDAADNTATAQCSVNVTDDTLPNNGGGGTTTPPSGDDLGQGPFFLDPTIVNDIEDKCKVNINVQNVQSCILKRGGETYLYEDSFPVSDGKVDIQEGISVPIGIYTLECKGTDGGLLMNIPVRACVLNPAVRES